MESTHTTVSVAGKELETTLLCSSVSGAQTLVMLHEGLGCIAMWKQFPQILAARFPYNILVYSRYGYGNSTPFKEKRKIDYLHREADTYLPALLEKFEIERPILFGHSDGATIALLYACMFPDKPLAVISIAAHIFVEEITLQGIRDARVVWETSKLRTILSKYHQDVDTVFWAWNETWLRPEFRDWSMEADLHNIKCPVLAVQGDRDEYGSPRQIDVIAEKTQNATAHLIANCAHIPHKDQPDALLDLMEKFLSAQHLL